VDPRAVYQNAEEWATYGAREVVAGESVLGEAEERGKGALFRLDPRRAISTLSYLILRLTLAAPLKSVSVQFFTKEWSLTIADLACFAPIRSNASAMKIRR
jgi:hypothetical protein